jgi:hypothetical protein
MKKIILFTATIATAIWSGGIEIGATIPPAAIVGFDNPIVENLIENTFTFKDAIIDIGAVPLGQKISPVNKPIYVKTNSLNGVTIEIEDPKGYLQGHLMDNDDNSIAMKYSLMGSEYRVKDHPVRSLISNSSDGANSIGTFVIEQKNSMSSDQPQGQYSVLFNVVIGAL